MPIKFCQKFLKFLFNVLLVSILLMRCFAAVENINCTSDANCTTSYSKCDTSISRCQCLIGFYDGGTYCQPINELKVGNPTLTLRSETYLEIEWIAPTASGAVEEFQYQVGSGIAISVNKETTANVTGLTPGSMYTIKIISVDTNSGPTTQTTYVEISFATMPAVPGPLDLANSDLTASDGQITIRWNSTGTVTSYTVTISELVTNPTKLYVPYQVIGGNVAKNGYRYTLTVKAHSNSLESAEYTEVFRTVITKPNPPTVPQTCLDDDRKSTSIYVRWQEPTYPNGDIHSYLIDTTGPTTVPQFNTSTNVLHQKVESLQEEMQYCFRVKTVNDGPDNIRTSDPSYQQQCCYTRAGLATVPTSVMLRTTSRSIQISWSKPSNTKGDLTGYRLRVLSSDVCVVEVILKCSTGCTPMVITHICATDTRLIQLDRNSTELMSSMSYVIDQLLPYTDYEVWINAINAAGDGDRNETSVQTDSEVPAVPGPLDLANSDLTASDGQITIRWNSTGTVTSYTVTISELVTNPTKLYVPYQVIGGNVAKNGYRYTLTVKAHSNSLESAEYTEVFRTVITKPNPPTVPQTCLDDDRKSTSIYVRWQEPTYPNGDIHSYLIDTTGPTTVPQFNTSTNVLHQKVEPLQEEMQYCFRVKTVNDGPDNIRTSDPSYQQQCCYTRAGLATVPTSVMLRTTSRSIQISWSKPSNTKGDLTGYRLRVLSSDVCVVEVILKCSTGCTPMVITYICATDTRSIQLDRNSTELMSSMSYVIDQLLPCTDYEVWINAINAAGDGDRNETSVQTDSEVPQKPLSVVASVVSSSEITVTWNQPPPRPGVTTYYVEAYEVVLNADPKHVKFSNLSGFSLQTTTFSGLEAYWNYTFSVAAATDKGNSDQSEKSVTGTTLQDAPGKVTHFEITIPANTLTTMQVSWAVPLLRDRNGIIKEYRISHNISGLYAVNTNNQIGQKVEMIYHAIPKSEIAQVSDNAYSIGTVVGTAIGCVLFTILVMGIVVYLILKRRQITTIKKSGPRQEQEEPQHGDQYEDLGMDNISPYQELGTKDIPNVYDQIGRVQTVDKHY